MNEKTFQIKDFLTDIDFNFMGEVEGIEEPFFDVQGVWKGKVTSTQQWIDVDSDFAIFIKNKLNTILKRNIIDGIQILRAKNPYDVHSDWVVTNNQVPIADPATSPPSYTVVIPLLDGDYKTIVFDQAAKYNNFNDYKKLNNSRKYGADSVFALNARGGAMYFEKPNYEHEIYFDKYNTNHEILS